MEETKAEFNKRRNNNIKTVVLWLIATALVYWWFFAPEKKYVIHLYDKKEDVLKLMNASPSSVDVFQGNETYKYDSSWFSAFYTEFRFYENRLVGASRVPSHILVR